MYACSYVLAKIIIAVSAHFPEETVEQWLSDIEVIECTEDKIVLYSPWPEKLENLQERCYPYILEVANNLLRCNAILEMWGPQELEQYKQSQKGMPNYPKPQFLFDNYFVGTSNEMATKAAKAVAFNPGKHALNPLYIYGPSGVGKTHLLCAILNEIKRTNPLKNVSYVLADVFVGELIWCLRNGTHKEFSKKYRSVDVLIVEDIQFLAGKMMAQEEFYYLFDYLYQSHKQLIFSANTYPSVIPNMERYLSTKFEQGVVIGITTPDINIRTSIVSQLAQKYNLRISDEVVSYIAAVFPESIRKIEGAIKELRAVDDFGNAKITLELVNNILQVIE